MPPTENPFGIMPLIRQLGEKLGGEPWVKQPEELPRVSPVQRLGRADVWPPEVIAQIQRFYAEQDEQDHPGGRGASLTSGPVADSKEQNHGHRR